MIIFHKYFRIKNLVPFLLFGNIRQKVLKYFGDDMLMEYRFAIKVNFLRVVPVTLEFSCA